MDKAESLGKNSFTHNFASLELRFGVKMSFGVIIISLVQLLKRIKLINQNKSVVEPTDDIAICVCLVSSLG
jgi:hypothetical protein